MTLTRICVVAALLLLLFGATAMAQDLVDFYGQVRIYNGTCNTGVGMNGVKVLLYSPLRQEHYETYTYTDPVYMNNHPPTDSPMGVYYFYDIPTGSDWLVEVVEPLGVTLATEPGEPSWWNENPRGYSYPYGYGYHRCFLMVLSGTNFQPHTMGYWKHQATCACGGNGNPQVPAALLQEYLDLVYDLFDGAQNFPIQGVSSWNGQPMTPANMLSTYNLPNGGSVGMVNKTKKQLLTMLLNIAAEYCYVWRPISVDQRNISQLIAFGADKIRNGGSNISNAHTALDLVNNGSTVPAGLIPASYGLTYYGNPVEEVISVNPEVPTKALLISNYPNPFNPTSTINFTLPAAAQVQLTIYNLWGQKVVDLLQGRLEAGDHQTLWNAAGYPSGTYIYHLNTDMGQTSGTMTLVK
ncbi:MAG: T9SS type A sorting domain-containing protein [bacterium]|nr:T9SS type A sorting domain-containing protein [bacterium]